MGVRFGSDLDNTLIDYSASVVEYCKQQKLGYCSDIRKLKKYLYELDALGYLWQRAQGWLYTEGLKFAKESEGSVSFCEFLTSINYKLFIVSHKTLYTPEFCGKKPLRRLAMNWIENSNFKTYFREPYQICFESTRELKVNRIRDLSLNYFVDDLKDVFLENEFPRGTKKFLIFEKDLQDIQINCAPTFRHIIEHLLNEPR